MLSSICTPWVTAVGPWPLHTKNSGFGRSQKCFTKSTEFSHSRHFSLSIWRNAFVPKHFEKCLSSYNVNLWRLRRTPTVAGDWQARVVVTLKESPFRSSLPPPRLLSPLQCTAVVVVIRSRSGPKMKIHLSASDLWKQLFWHYNEN